MNATELELQAGMDRLSGALELMRTGGEKEAVSIDMIGRLNAFAERILRENSAISVATHNSSESVLTIESAQEGEA